MRKRLILFLLMFAMVFVAGCGFLVFRQRWPFANSPAPQSPAIIPENPVLFGAACASFGFD